MSHFALVGPDGIVQTVIVAEQDFIDTLAKTPEGCQWVQTSYNTKGGKHIHPVTGEANTKPPTRKNFAGIGYTYDISRDAFIPPKQYASWVLDEDTCWWKPPIPRPATGDFEWNEDTVSWVELPAPRS